MAALLYVKSSNFGQYKQQILLTRQGETCQAWLTDVSGTPHDGLQLLEMAWKADRLLSISTTIMGEIDLEKA